MTNVTQNPDVLRRLSAVCARACVCVRVCVCACVCVLGIFLDPSKYTLLCPICDNFDFFDFRINALITLQWMRSYAIKLYLEPRFT